MIRAYENHWFPLIRPAIKPLFLGGGVGGTLGLGRLTSHDHENLKEIPSQRPATPGNKVLTSGIMNLLWWEPYP